jgi:hypothetical protein
VKRLANDSRLPIHQLHRKRRRSRKTADRVRERAMTGPPPAPEELSVKRLANDSRQSINERHQKRRKSRKPVNPPAH